MVGLTGFEPVTPRLSSVCSNQLSYKPYRKVTLLIIVAQNGGAEEIRTPDILLAKQTLYQLSYSPIKRLGLGSCFQDPIYLI
jgi:hypothetical protein